MKYPLAINYLIILWLEIFWEPFHVYVLLLNRLGKNRDNNKGTSTH